MTEAILCPSYTGCSSYSLDLEAPKIVRPVWNLIPENQTSTESVLGLGQNKVKPSSSLVCQFRLAKPGCAAADNLALRLN